MRRRVLVAESTVRNRSFVDGLSSLVGEAGADLAVGYTLIPGSETGNSSDTVRFGLIENLGIGRELGGGEFEYAGPAHSSENGEFSFEISSSSSKGVSLTGTFIGIGELFGTALDCVLPTE